MIVLLLDDRMVRSRELALREVPMPYGVKKQGSKWVCYNTDTGKVYGTHDTEAAATAQMKALQMKTGHSLGVAEVDES